MPKLNNKREMNRVQEKLNRVFEHIEESNREMGEIETDIGWIKTGLLTLVKKDDIKWLKWGIGVKSALIIALIGALVGLRFFIFI